MREKDFVEGEGRGGVSDSVVQTYQKKKNKKKKSNEKNFSFLFHQESGRSETGDSLTFFIQGCVVKDRIALKPRQNEQLPPLLSGTRITCS